MKITADDLKLFDIVDEIVPEVPGGAHTDPAEQARIVGDVLERQFDELAEMGPEDLVRDRYDRFRRLGEFQIV